MTLLRRRETILSADGRQRSLDETILYTLPALPKHSDPFGYDSSCVFDGDAEPSLPTDGSVAICLRLDDRLLEVSSADLVLEEDIELVERPILPLGSAFTRLTQGKLFSPSFQGVGSIPRLRIEQR
jgi:hypothetical protein